MKLKTILCTLGALVVAGITAYASPPTCLARHQERQSTSLIVMEDYTYAAFPDPGRVVSIEQVFHPAPAIAEIAGVNLKSYGIAFDVGKFAVLTAIGTESNGEYMARGFVNVPFDVGKTGAATASSGNLGVDGWVYDIGDARQHHQAVTDSVTG